MKWAVLSGGKLTSLTPERIVEVLLQNRGVTSPKLTREFLHPTKPDLITLAQVGLSSVQMAKVIDRLRQARKSGEGVVVFGDYDADGICATAIAWEALNAAGLSVLPFIPDRFSQGYGLNAETLAEMKSKDPNLSLVVTVDNGIVANEAVEAANSLGIDVILTDHHQVGKTKPKTKYIIHTTQVGGAGVAWFLAREIRKAFKVPKSRLGLGDGLDLAAIGTVADILPLTGANRSIVKYGLETINTTKRPGLAQIISEAGRLKGEISTYELGFVIAPRINAMGRLAHGIDALRALCTRDRSRARQLATLLGKTNQERQDIVEKVVSHAKELAKHKKWPGAVLVADASYHEGVIGLAAARLVQEYYRPAIVFSLGKEKSKASARSVEGFNIIQAIHKFDHLLEGGGGHPMAAGFNIATANVKKFINEFSKYSASNLTKSILTRQLRVDMEVDFAALTKDLYAALAQFAPTGLANPAPTFLTRGVDVLEAKKVGRTGDHLKLTLSQADKIFKAIAFGIGQNTKIIGGSTVDIVYTLEENEWNGRKSLELRVKDIVNLP